MSTPFAFDVLAALKCWVFYTFCVNLNVFCTHCEVCSVHTVVHLIVLLSSLITVAQFALKLKEIATLFSFVLLGFQHVITFRAKPNPLELRFWLCLRLL